MLSILGSSPDAFDEVAVETTRLMAEFVSRVLRNSNELEERRQLVEELQESESRFRGAFHSSSLGMALTALDGTFVQVNDKLAEMLGYTVDELSSLGVRGMTHPDDIEVDVERGKQLRSGEIDSYQREKRYVRKDGSVTVGRPDRLARRGHDGSPTHVVSHVQDITAQKEANLLFEATFERSVVPTLIADDERRIVALNEIGGRAARCLSRRGVGADASTISRRSRSSGLVADLLARRCPRRPRSPCSGRTVGARVIEFIATADRPPRTAYRRRPRPHATGASSRRSCARRRRWRRSAASPAASRTTSTTS